MRRAPPRRAVGSIGSASRIGLRAFASLRFISAVEATRAAGWPFGARCAGSAALIVMARPSLTPRVRAALRRLAAGPQDMRDEALLREINDELKKLPVDEIAYIRDRVRYSCPPCPMVQSVVLMLNGLIEVKNLQL